MRSKIQISVLFLSLVLSQIIFAGNIYPSDEDSPDIVWLELRGKHFIVLYTSENKKDEMENILEKAEGYYKNIAEQIGYRRYNNFWTWDKRARIVMYPDKDTYLKETGKPSWSSGYSNEYNESFKSRAIVAYEQDKDFLEGTLPHEIGHLILRDFIGSGDTIPVWFDEGVAQLQEKDKLLKANFLMKHIVDESGYVPFDSLFVWDIRQEEDPLKVAVFYSESLSIVAYMISEYGSEMFGRLCSSMKEGDSFEKAFDKVYSYKMGSLSDLEKKWLSYMKNY